MSKGKSSAARKKKIQYSQILSVKMYHSLRLKWTVFLMGWLIRFVVSPHAHPLVKRLLSLNFLFSSEHLFHFLQYGQAENFQILKFKIFFA